MTSSAIQTAQPKMRPYALIVVAFILIESTGIFEQLMVYVALPTLIRVLDINLAAVTWSITLFLLIGAGTVALIGRLGDLYGRRKLLVIVICLSLAGSIISAALGNYEGLLIGRALQGTSTAVFPLLVGLAREAVPAKRVPVLIGFTTGSSFIAGSLGALLAGVLLGVGSWRIIFVASAILTVVALILVMTVVRKSPVAPHEKNRIDFAGAILMVPGVAAVLFGIDTASGVGWGSPTVWVLIVGGLVILAVWVTIELRIKNPMFDLRIFKNRALTMIMAATGLIGLGVFAAGGLLNPILTQSPTTFPVGLGLTPAVAAEYGLIAGVIAFVLSPVGGRIAARRGAKVTLSIGAAVSVVGFIGFIVGVHNLPLAIIATVFTGVGSAFILAGIPNMIVEVVDPNTTGEAVGLLYGVGRTLFEAIGTALIGIFLSIQVVKGTTAPTFFAWSVVCWFVIGTAALALLVALFVKKVKPMDERGDVIEALAEEQADEAAFNATPHAAPAA